MSVKQRSAPAPTNALVRAAVCLLLALVVGEPLDDNRMGNEQAVPPLVASPAASVEPGAASSSAPPSERPFVDPRVEFPLMPSLQGESHTAFVTRMIEQGQPVVFLKFGDGEYIAASLVGRVHSVRPAAVHLR